MSATTSLLSLTEIREACERTRAMVPRGLQIAPLTVSISPDNLLALVDAVEAAQAAWIWIDAVARSVDDHQLAHGARTARQALSLKLVLFEESTSEYGRV